MLNGVFLTYSLINIGHFVRKERDCVKKKFLWSKWCIWTYLFMFSRLLLTYIGFFLHKFTFRLIIIRFDCKTL